MAMSRSLGGTSLTTRSPIRIVPLVASSRPAIIRSVVLFPQPDGPTRTTNSSSAMVNETRSTAFTPPGYTLVVSVNVTQAIELHYLRVAADSGTNRPL